VRPHQDSAFLYTDPPSALGFWYALEDATATNGCLSFVQGSHRTTGVKKRFVRKVAGRGTEFIGNDGGQFPLGRDPEECMAQDEYRMAEVKAGSLVLIHGNVLHKSEKNLSPKSRFVYTFHIIESEGVVYDKRNWLQPPDGGFTRL
jgi:phytanoyl-CoA hydroxylase